MELVPPKDLGSTIHPAIIAFIEYTIHGITIHCSSWRYFIAKHVLPLTDMYF